ncbi:hypothetical protein AHF37_03466 [Paragonimus kellicotti]|nr:hypothetical protein AHF37_03466 [Paragonimus kellicotti]
MASIDLVEQKVSSGSVRNIYTITPEPSPLASEHGADEVCPLKQGSPSVPSLTSTQRSFVLPAPSLSTSFQRPQRRPCCCKKIPEEFWYFILPQLVITTAVMVFLFYSVAKSNTCDRPSYIVKPAGSETSSTKTTENIHKHCLLPTDPGSCRSAIPMYTFDSTEWRCVSFVYTGCKGNANRFLDLETCVSQCH